MTKQVISTDRAPRNAHYSQAVVAAGLVFVSGQGPFDPASGAIIASIAQA